MSLQRVRTVLRNCSFWPLFIGLAVWIYSSGSAQAGISFVDMFRSDAYRQTANGNSAWSRSSASGTGSDFRGGQK